MSALQDLFSRFFSGTAQSRRAQRTGQPPLAFRDRLNALKYLPTFFAMIWATSPALSLLNIFLRILRAAVPLVSLYLGKLILDEVVSLTQHSPALNGTTPRDFSTLIFYLGLELGVAVLSDVLGRCVALLDSIVGDLFSNQTSIRLMQHAATLDLELFEDATFYDKLERARQQTTSRISLMSQVLGQAQDTITMAFLAAGLVTFNPWLILLLVLSLVPAFLGESFFNGQTYSLLYNWTPERRELDYVRFTGASDETAKEVKVFGLSPFLIERYRTLSQEFFLANRTLALRRAAWGAALGAVGSAGYYAAYILIAYRTVEGAFSVGDLTFLVGSFARLKGLTEGILSRFSSVAEGSLYLRDLFEFFELKPRIASPQNPLPFPRPIQHGFTFENVGFKYSKSGSLDAATQTPDAGQDTKVNGNDFFNTPNGKESGDDNTEQVEKPRERWAVRHLSFTLRAGEKLALVGENGAGKTTLVKLLARLYSPTEGRILLDGHDLAEYDLGELRSEIGIIFQDFVKYQMTARDNIAVGRIAERENQPKIDAASERSLASSVIAKLPEGYAQMIGKRFAKGVDLSGGEWQKVALARAYMRDAQLLILDEPTAALDARAEHEVFQRFADLTTGKSAVLISHRFSTVRMADRILVLEQGQMTEIGTHEELILKGGKYAELFHLQAESYR